MVHENVSQHCYCIQSLKVQEWFSDDPLKLNHEPLLSSQEEIEKADQELAAYLESRHAQARQRRKRAPEGAAERQAAKKRKQEELQQAHEAQAIKIKVGSLKGKCACTPDLDKFWSACNM